MGLILTSCKKSEGGGASPVVPTSNGGNSPAATPTPISQNVPSGSIILDRSNFDIDKLE